MSQLYKDAFLIPMLDEIFDELHVGGFILKIDLKTDFHQFHLSPSSIEKSTFWTHNDHFEFQEMPFGLCNLLSTFQLTMNFIFHD